MIAGVQRFSRARPRAADTVVAVALLVVCVPLGLLTQKGTTAEHRWPTALFVVAAACAALPWRRRYPRAVVAATTACSLVAAFAGLLLTPLLIAPLLTALYWLASSGDRTNTWAFTTGASLLLLAAAMPPSGLPDFILTAVNPIAFVVLFAILGGTVQLRRAYLRALEARAEYAERTREDEARHRVAEERVRIARELHDVVAHHLALANAQAGTAAHLARRDPDQAYRLLEGLTESTSAALRDLKATVGLLRDVGGPDSPLEPAPGLDDLPRLAASFAAAGLAVDITVDGSPRPLSAGAELTAYRIVQEALTNVTKHARTEAAHVHLAYEGRLLTIAITDHGPSARAAEGAGGHGLIGMRERARSVGGSLTTGYLPEGGFQVTARLPLGPHHPEETSTS
ncbi:MAG TPA: sensor histidine kinase [Spirillospora sp.]|nr:sensor histidine kinase [Spirillospora sp.]